MVPSATQLSVSTAAHNSSLGIVVALSAAVSATNNEPQTSNYLRHTCTVVGDDACVLSKHASSAFGLTTLTCCHRRHNLDGRVAASSDMFTNSCQSRHLRHHQEVEGRFGACGVSNGCRIAARRAVALVPSRHSLALCVQAAVATPDSLSFGS